MSGAQNRRTAPPIVIERSYRAALADIWDLWTTKAGFESWWGPQGFRAEVHELDARAGGALRYDMIADTPEMIAAMTAMGQPPSHLTNARFTLVRAHERLVITNVMDFLPGVDAYESVVTLDPLHSEQFSKMQCEGMTSQLTKLDPRFA